MMPVKRRALTGTRQRRAKWRRPRCSGSGIKLVLTGRRPGFEGAMRTAEKRLGQEEQVKDSEAPQAAVHGPVT